MRSLFLTSTAPYCDQLSAYIEGMKGVSVQKDRDKPNDLGELRRRAEAAWRERGSDADRLLADDIPSLVQELEIHQIELEMQNEDLRQAQEKLEAARDRYADLYDFAPVAHLTVNENGQILEANLTAAGLLGTERGVLLGKSLSRFIAPEDQDLYYKHGRAVLAAKKRQTCELRMVTRRGTRFDSQLQSVGIPDNDGTITRWRTVISDVTEQKRAEKALQSSERKYRSLFDEALDMIYIVDRDYRVTDMNATGLAALGYSREECIGRPLMEIIPPDYRERTAKALKRVFAGDKIHAHETAFVTSNDDTIPVEVSAFPQEIKGKIVAARAICRDITEHKQITRELSRRLEEQRGLNLILRGIQEDAQTPTQVLEIAVDRVVQISWFRARAAAFLLRGQQLRKVVSRNLPPAVDLGCAQVALGQCLCGRVAETGESIICNKCSLETDEWHHHDKGIGDHGHVILPLKWQSQVLGVLCFYVAAWDELDDRRNDFLEAVAAIVATAIGRLTYQSQLAQSERLSSVGLLAAGVAHEINNPLGLVLTNVEWLKEDLPPILEHCRTLREQLVKELGAEHAKALLSDLDDLRNDELLRDMAQCTQGALDGVRRVRTIVRDLGTFTRADNNQLSEISLVDILEQAITLAQNEIKYRARLTRDFKQTPAVRANEGRLSQVFLNLLVNAAHAIGKGHPEDNEIRVRVWHEGEEVIAEVKDTGKGIDPADLPYVFEPFFTTKEKGVGTGLGLYISNSIVTSLGGHIDVESTVGRGSRFVIRLPVAEPLSPGSTAKPGDKERNPMALL
jgi:PAS domain S-box-containing protein